MTPKLVIATPVRGSDLWSTYVTTGYSECVRKVVVDLGAEVISAVFTYNCDNIRARNRMAAIALHHFPDMTHVLWWDDDQWPEDLHIISEMMAMGEDMVSIPYTNKKMLPHFVHMPFIPGRPQDEKGFIEVKGVGFGFTMTSRACLEKMTASARKYTDVFPRPGEDVNNPKPFPKIANIFGQLYDHLIPGKTEEEDESLMSEDFSFCKRWRDLGGSVKLYTRGPFIAHAGLHPFSARDIPGMVVKEVPMRPPQSGGIQAQGASPPK